MNMRIFLIFFYILTFSVQATNGISTLPSLEWQKNELESKVYNKINRGVNVLLNHDHFFVDVNISISEPEVPKFNKPLNKTDDNIEDSSDEDTTSNSLNNNDDEESEDEESNNNIKFTNDLPEADYGESVVFSKFGMEAPLIDDFKDFAPAGKIVLTMGEDNKKKIDKIKSDFEKEKEVLNKQIKKLKEASNSKPSVVEQMWMYNTSVDIFKNISSIEIVVRLPKSLEQDDRVKLEGLIKTIKIDVSTVKPRFKFEYNVEIPEVKESISNRDMMAAVGGLLNVIAIVIGVILIGFVGNRLISRFFELNSGSQNGGSFTMKNDGQQDEDEKEENERSGLGSSEASSEIEVQSLNGIDRFKVYASNAPQEAILLIKKWIAESRDNVRAASALRALVQQIENNLLQNVFNTLNENERGTWRELLNKPLTTNELAIANNFISNQIVQNVIVPSLIEDPETYDLLLKLNSDVVNSIYEKDPYVVSLLLNALNDNFVAEVLSNCDESIVADILNTTIVIKEDDVRAGQSKIKETLSKFVKTENNLPFVEKLFEILPRVTSNVEKSIFDTLKNNIDFDQFLNLSRNYYPSELIEKLPSKFLKESLNQYDLRKRVNMLMGLNDTMKNSFLDICAPDGTKARDLINIEFESIERDEMLLSKVLNEKEDNWKDFVTYIRNSINGNKEFRSEIDQIVLDWANSKYGDHNTDINAA